MKTKQEAERAEQQRIKNLVLNYDLQDSADQEGTFSDFNTYNSYFLQSNPNLSGKRTKQPPVKKLAYDSENQGSGDKHHYNSSLHQSSGNISSRNAEKAANSRGGQRARKLQLSDVDW